MASSELVLAATVKVVEGRGGEGEQEDATVGSGRRRLILFASISATCRGTEGASGKTQLISFNL